MGDQANQYELENLEDSDGEESSNIDNAENGKPKRSPWWEHFDEIVVNGVDYAKCKYCPLWPKGYCTKNVF